MQIFLPRKLHAKYANVKRTAHFTGAPRRGLENIHKRIMRVAFSYIIQYPRWACKRAGALCKRIYHAIYVRKCERHSIRHGICRYKCAYTRKNFAITTQGSAKWPRLFAVTWVPDHRETILSSQAGARLFMLFIARTAVTLITIVTSSPRGYRWCRQPLCQRERWSWKRGGTSSSRSGTARERACLETHTPRFYAWTRSVSALPLRSHALCNRVHLVTA